MSAAGAAGNGVAAGGDAAVQGAATNGRASTQSNGNGGPDVGALTETLGQMRESQEQMREFLSSNPWHQQAPPGEGADAEPDADLDLSFLDDADGSDDDSDEFDAESGFDDTAQMTENIANAFQAAAAPLAQEVGEVRQEIDDVRQERGWHDLLTEFPEVADTEYMEPLFDAARAFGEVHGLPARVAASPVMLRTLYLAQKGYEAAQEEAEQLANEQPSVARLEGGAGAGPASSRNADAAGQFLAGDGSLGSKALPFR